MGNRKRSSAPGVGAVAVGKGTVVHARSEREKLHLEQKKRRLRALAMELRSADAKDTEGIDARFQELRNLAFAPHGFVSDDLRRLLWPLLLGETRAFVPVKQQHESHYTKGNASHHDDQQIEKDIDRSLWYFDVVMHIREAERRMKRRQLTQIINAVLCGNPDLYYYQGYHDVCSVFLLVLGDQLAFRAVREVSATYHREPMRKNFEIVLHATRLLYALLEPEDPQLFAHMKQSGVEPFFAMPWMITWFAHQLTRFSDVARIYDVLLVSHPLFVLYMSAAVVLEARHRVLKADCDFGTLHGLLAKLPQTMDIERVICRGAVLLHRHPPDALLASSEHQDDLRSSMFSQFPYSFHKRFTSVDKSFLAPHAYEKHDGPSSSVQKASPGKSSIIARAIVVGLVAITLSYALRYSMQTWLPILAADRDNKA